MGKPITVQKRGKGSMAYRAPSFNFRAKATHPPLQMCTQTPLVGVITDITTCPAHTAPLALVDYGSQMVAMIAPEGVHIGQQLQVGKEAESKVGNTLELQDIPEGTFIFNIEAQPGDGGKYVRASGGYARLEAKTPKGIVVRMPSKKNKIFHKNARATIGIVAGGGRKDKPLLKAGNKRFKREARNQLYPRVSASAMNAVDHPYGNKRTSRKSKATPVSRHAPPGAKVGMVAARRTGQRK